VFRARLEGLFGAHPRLGAARQALQEPRGLYDALQALNRFRDLY